MKQNSEVQNYIKSRRAMGWKSNAIARDFGISRQWLHKLEMTGEIKSVSLLIRISKLMRKSPNEVLGWQNEPRRPT